MSSQTPESRISDLERRLEQLFKEFTKHHHLDAENRSTGDAYWDYWDQKSPPPPQGERKHFSRTFQPGLDLKLVITTAYFSNHEGETGWWVYYAVDCQGNGNVSCWKGPYATREEAEAVDWTTAVRVEPNLV